MKHRTLADIAPEELKAKLTVDDQTFSLIRRSRCEVRDIISGKTDKLLVIIGPCSVHDTESAIEYCKMLAEKRQQLADTLEIVMRVYIEKPRTITGWKGLINDPRHDESYNITEGLEVTRKLMLQVNKLGVPVGTECLNPLITNYIGDLLCWGSVGARNTESQVHREMASGLMVPFGFKNSTDGSYSAALNSIISSSTQHHFLAIETDGRISAKSTRGNNDCHLVLRGGTRPNYDVSSVRRATKELDRRKLVSKVIIDVSHSNSQKDHRKQVAIVEGIAERYSKNESIIGGVMIESSLVEGRQDIVSSLQYGQSITDACVSWEDSSRLLAKLSEAVLIKRVNSQVDPR